MDDVYRLSWTRLVLDPEQQAYEAAGRYSRVATEADGILSQARQLHQWSIDGTEPIQDVVLQQKLPDGSWSDIPLHILTEPEVD